MEAHPIRYDSYVSELLRQSLVRNLARSGKPFGETLPSALLFADLSGFTDFAERLVDDHVGDAEDTQRILNQHFCRVLEIIAHWGGSVLKFAGDGTIAFWTVGAHCDLALCTRRAARCALEIQAAIDALIASGELAQRQRLVVAAGDAWLAHVGGIDGKWEFIAGGAPWNQIALADAIAAPGEVVLSPQAWAQVEPVSAGAAVGRGCHSLRLCEATPPGAGESPGAAIEAVEAVLERYLSRTTKAQIRAGHHGWLAELRRVTVLFLKIQGFDHRAPNALERLHAATQAIQRTVASHDGNVLQLMVDDKGLVLLTAWGLALSSHEDDAERALMAASALSAALEGLGLSCRIGIKSGKVFAGLLGSDQHLEYAIIGDPVNAAGRLMLASMGRPLCDRTTREAARRRFEFELAGSVQVKGKAEPIETFLVVGERADRRAPQRMVGRGSERAFVERILDAARRSAGAVPPVHVVGEAGVGKSCLAEFLVERASARGLACVMGAGDDLRRADPCHAWGHVVAALLDLEDPADSDAVLAAVAALPDQDRRTPLLNALLPVCLPETSYTLSLDGAGRAASMGELLAEVAAAAQQRAPRLLVLDDAQWFDSSSWQLVETLHRRVPGLPIVLLSRPLVLPDVPAEARRVLESSELESLELGPLSFDDGRSLIARRLGVDSVSDDLAYRVFERAEGNPLFTEELLLCLDQQQGIHRADQGATITRESRRPAPLVLSESVERSVASRLAGLDPGHQLSLQVASVLGHRFTIDALSEVLPAPLSRVELVLQLEAICGTRLIEHDPDGGDGDYRFRHAVIQQAVHELLSSHQQRELHRSAAEYYERGDDAELARNHALLARHWGLAEVDGRAIEHLERAAHRARAQHANLEVVALMLEALERAPRCPELVPERRRAGWEQLLGEAEADLGLHTQAELHLRRAVTALDRPQPDTRSARGLALAREWGKPACIRALGRTNPLPDRERALASARCYSTLARIHYDNHELERMVHATVAGANLALRAGGDSPVLARLLANLAIVAISVPGVESEYYCVEAIEMAERLGEPAALYEVLAVVAIYEGGAARFAHAIEHFERSMAVARSVGASGYRDFARASLANVLRLRGEFERADEADAEVLRSGLDRSAPKTQVWGLFGRACALTSLGRLDELAELLVDFGALLDDEEVRQQVSASNTVAHLLTSALLDLRRGRGDAAIEAVGRSVALVDSLDHLQSAMVCVVSHLQDALMALWRCRPGDRRIRTWSQKADRFVERCASMFPVAMPRALIGRGNRALRKGRARRAAKLWREAAAEAQRLDNPYDQAQAHHQLAELVALDAAERQHHRQCCRRELGELGIEAPYTWMV